MEKLTIEVAYTLVGKKIQWQAPAYHMNQDYNGVAIINGIIQDPTGYRLNVICLDGDDLSYAKAGNEKTAYAPPLDGHFWYSDFDRFITFEVIE